jgi:hypothetical protein
VEPEKLILDGQQRLTSLFLALRSGRPVPTQDSKKKRIDRVYYLNIRKCLDPQEDRIEAVVSIPADRRITKDFGRQVEFDLSTTEMEHETDHFPLSALFDRSAYDLWRRGYQRRFRSDERRLDLFDEFESQVVDRFRLYKVPTIELLRDTPKEAVCQVFEKVNTGGVSLTIFELMTATFAADNFQLRKDWESRALRLEAQPVLGTKDAAVIGGTDFLQAATLLASYKRSVAGSLRSAVSVKRKDVLQLTLQEYQANAAAVEAGFVRAARLLNREMIFDVRNLPYGAQLVPLAAACAFLGDRFEEDLVRRKIARWFWCGVFGELYGGANETRFAQDIQDLCGWILEGGAEPRTIRDASFTPTRLLTLQSRQSAAYKGLFALMVKEGSYDFISADPIAHTSDFALPVDIHHIFPRAWAEKQGLPSSHWNSVINKAPLTARTNRILSGSAPSQYLRRIVAEGVVTEDRLDGILRSHFIEPTLLREDQFQHFLRDRASRLLDAIQRAMDKEISGRDSEEVFREFGGPLGVPGQGSHS